MRDDSFTWGQRSEFDIDCMSDQMARDRLGTVPYRGNVSGEASPMDCPCDYYGESLAAQGLERFDGFSEKGTRVEPMFDGQTAYKGYEDQKDGWK